MSFRPFTEKIRKKKMEFVRFLGRIRIRLPKADPTPESGSASK